MLDAEELSKIWRATANESKLSKSEFANFKVGRAAQAILSAHLSLRAEGHAAYGLSHICDSQAQYLLEDSQRVDENTGVAFRDYLAHQSSMESDNKRRRVNDASDILNLDTSGLPLSLLSNNNPTANNNAADMSIDAIMRDGDEQVAGDTTDIFGQVDDVVRTAEQEQAIANELDFTGLSLDNNDPGMDYGPDLDYSSSPPHTPVASTPLDEPLVAYGQSTPLQQQTKTIRKPRSAVFDDDINIRRPPRSRLLRRLPALPTKRGKGASKQKKPADENEEESELYIPLDEKTELLLDPVYVQTEMRHRLQQAGDNHEVIEEGSDEQADVDMDYGMDNMDGDMGFEYNAEDDDEDTEEMLEQDMKQAKNTVKNALKNRGDKVKFDELADARRSRACTFMEVLFLAAKGRITAEQPVPWGNITLTKVK